MFNSDPKKFKNGSLDTRNYKHPKYCYYIHDQNIVYKVIGYHHTISQYKIQSTIDPSKTILVGPFDIAGIQGKEANESLKKRFG